jgi:hypothetical protein
VCVCGLGAGVSRLTDGSCLYYGVTNRKGVCVCVCVCGLGAGVTGMWPPYYDISAAPHKLFHNTTSWVKKEQGRELERMCI